MAELAFDVVEQILVRLDVKDLIQYKSVCKSWLSLISGPRFVQAHLNHNIKSDRDNRQLGHRRICHSKYMPKDRWVRWNEIIVIVGSCNGLVCFSPRDVELVVTNPLTREQKKLPTPPYRLNMDGISMIRVLVCWGFGYDSCADDYKVIVGFRNTFDINWTTFFVLTLKSNTWKVIGEIRDGLRAFTTGSKALGTPLKDGAQAQASLGIIVEQRFAKVKFVDADETADVLVAPLSRIHISVKLRGNSKKVRNWGTGTVGFEGFNLMQQRV
ncbi:F-box protein CPR1-like [Bidens hawaiensis]|uniref:F-box protein CPR1-like n=1 Tax=Bidens hawaiensis TaxID=980011 RepID=UPI00404A8DB1